MTVRKQYWLAIPALMVLCSCGRQDTYDPVSMDLPVYDEEYPATMVEAPAELTSEGKRLNGIIYLAQGKGPHPTVLLLHGLPGNERNLDLGHALRRAGFNVVFFHYRGAWGSEGEFLFANCLVDTKNVLQFLRGKDAREKYRVDSERIILVGHSLGGAIAILVGSQDPDVRGVVSIAGANMALGTQYFYSPDKREQYERGLENMLPLRLSSGKYFIDDIYDNQEEYDNLRSASGLAANSILLIAGSRDEVLPVNLHHEPLVKALEEAGAADMTEIVLDADHLFSNKRIALARTIIDWIEDHL